MRPTFQPRPGSPRPFAERHATSQVRVAASLLGADHRLVETLRSLGAAHQQVLVLVAIQAVGCVLFLEGATFGLALVLSAAIVQSGLAVRLAALEGTRRELCLLLIAERGRLSQLMATEREWRRLRSARLHARLARSLESVADPRTRVRDAMLPGPPLLRRAAIEPIEFELLTAAALLREPEPGPSGVAIVELLLTRGDSSLYGDDPELLRQDLGRARFQLAAGSGDHC